MQYVSMPPILQNKYDLFIEEDFITGMAQLPPFLKPFQSI